MFRALVLIIRRSKLHYSASGIIKPIGGRLVHETATYRCDDTTGWVMQFWPPDDEHKCSKHVEAWNELIVKQKFCVSSWSITEIIILKCTVSKMSTFNIQFQFKGKDMNTTLTFRGPYIVIYSYNRSQRDVLFLKFIWLSTLHVPDRSIIHQQENLNTVYTQ